MKEPTKDRHDIKLKTVRLSEDRSVVRLTLALWEMLTSLSTCFLHLLLKSHSDVSLSFLYVFGSSKMCLRWQRYSTYI